MWNAEGLVGKGGGAARGGAHAGSTGCRRQVLVDFVRHVTRTPAALRAAQPLASKTELRRQLDLCTRLTLGSGRRSVVPGIMKGELFYFIYYRYIFIKVCESCSQLSRSFPKHIYIFIIL